MSTKKTIKNLAVKVPKFKLISYTIKAVIPTGQYANIQPEVTVEAETIQEAERAVMPHIEALFAKYRDGGVKPVEPIINEPAPEIKPTTASEIPKERLVPTETPAIVLSAPFNRAKGAIESCMSVEALKLVSDQIVKSVKLVDSEKVELKKISDDKLVKLNGTK